MNIPCKAIVLAAGKGIRMQSDIPKVLHLLKGKPLILHVIDTLALMGLQKDDIIVVVGYKGDSVIQTVGDRAIFAWQKEQLGTGHAVMQTQHLLQDFEGIIIVACGDVPLIKSTTFKLLVDLCSPPNVGASVLTMELDNPTGYGRILRDSNGNLIQIIEEKDATDPQKLIKEVNTGTYAFKSHLLFNGLSTITPNNAQREYYLPDVLPFIQQSGYNVKLHKLANSIEGSGINSKDELLKLEELLLSNTIF